MEIVNELAFCLLTHQHTEEHQPDGGSSGSHEYTFKTEPFKKETRQSSIRLVPKKRISLCLC